MQKSFGFLPEGGGFNKWIPLKGVSEIELTGEFEPREYLAHYRMAVVRYNDGREETGSICLNSESFNGCWRKESRFREWDKFIIYDKRGAVLIPLDLVRKIIPRNLQAESIQEAKKNEP